MSNLFSLARGAVADIGTAHPLLHDVFLHHAAIACIVVFSETADALQCLSTWLEEKWSLIDHRIYFTHFILQ
jgi:hypothetical protein